jgi:hypothetical protein
MNRKFVIIGADRVIPAFVESIIGKSDQNEQSARSGTLPATGICPSTYDRPSRTIRGPVRLYRFAPTVPR